MYPLLDAINSPSQLRELDQKKLPQFANELRSFLIESVAKTGGHLSSNLGTVELTIALHYVFNTPHDQLVWDVGHQTYTQNSDRPARRYESIAYAGWHSRIPATG